MDGPTLVALISVLVAGTTSVAAPVIAGRNQRRNDASRFAHERAMKDMDELRALLDEIALALPLAFQGQGALRSKHNTSGSTDMDDYTEQIVAFTEARERVFQLQTRLILRLGRTHVVSKACEDAIAAIDKAGGETLALVTLDQPRPVDWQERSVSERIAMSDARHRFIDAASGFVSAPIQSLRR